MEQSGDEIQMQFSPFLNSALEKVASLRSELDEIENLRLKMANYLAEDKSFKLEDSISTFAKFADQVKFQILPLLCFNTCELLL